MLDNDDVICGNVEAQKMKFSLKDFFSKCDQIRSFLWILVPFTEWIFNEKLHFLFSAFLSQLRRHLQT